MPWVEILAGLHNWAHLFLYNLGSVNGDGLLPEHMNRHVTVGYGFFVVEIDNFVRCGLKGDTTPHREDGRRRNI